MFYLSRLILNPRSRRVRCEIANPYEMHRTLSHAFTSSEFNVDRRLENTSGVLFRLDVHPNSGIPTLLVQSQIKPVWSFLQSRDDRYLLDEDALPVGVENPAVKPFDLNLYSGQVLAFRLRANPTCKKDCDGKKQGRREGLLREEDQLKWLRRKIGLAGAVVLSANLTHDQLVHGKKQRDESKHRFTFVSVQFDGILSVINPDLLLTAIRGGIGSAKGFGFGLLSIAPAP